MSHPLLRLATHADLIAINDIYNYYVINSTCTYQIDPETIENRKAWFREHSKTLHPVTVVEVDGRVIGWGSISKFRPRAAFFPTVAPSIYIQLDWHRKGIGRMILSDLIQRARQAGHHSLIGGISAEQTASIELHRILGFREVGRLREVGYKFGAWLDLLYMQLTLNSGTDMTAVSMY
jgi:phosphinothricin acetyltransferase